MSIACPSVFVKLEPIVARSMTILAIEQYRESMIARSTCAKLMASNRNREFVRWDDLSDRSLGQCRDNLLKAILAWSPDYRPADTLYTRYEKRGVRYKGTVYLAVYNSRDFDLKPGETDRRGSKCMVLRAVKAKTAKALAKVNAPIVDLDAEAN